MTATIEEADQMRERSQDMIRAEMAREDHDDHNRARAVRCSSGSVDLH